MRLVNVEVTDLWSFAGPTRSTLGEFGDVNVIIGKNNSGKSNILRLLRYFSQNAIALYSPQQSTQLPGGDIYDPGTSGRTLQPAFQVTLAFGPSDKGIVNDVWVTDASRRPFLEAWADRTLLATFSLEFGSTGKASIRTGSFDPVSENELSRHYADWSRPNSAGRSLLLRSLAEHAAPRIIYLGGWRRPDDPVGTSQTLYDFWDQLARTGSDDRADYRLYRRILNRFVDLTGMRVQAISKHKDKQTLLVEIADRKFDLKRLGDGITHLLMFAIEIETRTDCVALVEEPETHLHPQLQRRAVRALAEKNRNQIILTTHSPVLLDAGIADRVFATEHNGESTIVRLAVEQRHQLEILDEIGARASDLLQANVVIWVEGPSDRVFIKRCIDLAIVDDAPLREGIEYQFVLYGGSNRAHFTAGADSGDLINVLRLGRKVVMVADSDRGAESDSINDTKARLDKAVKECGGLSWVTHGREIENYLAGNVIARTCSDLHSSEEPAIDLGMFDRVDEVIARAVPNPPAGLKWSTEYSGNKVRLMAEFAKRMKSGDLNVLDLKAKIAELVEFIRSANSDGTRADTRS